MPAPQEQAALSVDERIAQVGNNFLDGLDEHQDPNQTQEAVEEAPAEEAPLPVENEEQPPEAEAEPEIELREIEYEGKQYKVAPELREAFLRQSDYSRNIAQVKASQKNVEQMTLAASQVLQAAQQLAPVHAKLHSMQSQAQALYQQLTPQLRAEDPIGYNTTQGDLNLLIREIDQGTGFLNHATQQLAAQQENVRKQLMQEQLPALIKDIPDIQKAETRDALATYAVETGLPQEALEFMKFSPPAVRLLWESMQYRKLMKDQAKAQASLKSKVAGVPGVKPTGRAADQGAQVKQAQAAFRKGGGKLNDGNLDALLKARGI